MVENSKLRHPQRRMVPFWNSLVTVFMIFHSCTSIFYIPSLTFHMLSRSENTSCAWGWLFGAWALDSDPLLPAFWAFRRTRSQWPLGPALAFMLNGLVLEKLFLAGSVIDLGFLGAGVGWWEAKRLLKGSSCFFGGAFWGFWVDRGE